MSTYQTGLLRILKCGIHFSVYIYTRVGAPRWSTSNNLVKLFFTFSSMTITLISSPKEFPSINQRKQTSSDGLYCLIRIGLPLIFTYLMIMLVTATTQGGSFSWCCTTKEQGRWFQKWFLCGSLRWGESTEAWERGVMLMVSQWCLTSLGCIYY